MISKLLTTLYIILPILHAGIVLGVSFFATPVKFLAPSLTLPVALDIGKVTFHILIKLEWLLVCTYLIILWLNSSHKLKYNLIYVIVIILAAQAFFILPILDERIILIQQSQPLKVSHYHLIYILLDFIKITLLLGIVYGFITNLLRD